MWTAKIKAGVLKDFLNIASALVDEIVLEINKDGVSYRHVDPAHVAMCVANLSSKGFVEFNYNETAAVTKMFLNLEKVHDIYRFLRPSDIVTLSYPVFRTVKLDASQNREKKDLSYNVEYVQIVYHGLNKRFKSSETLAAGITDPKIPKINLPNSFQIKKSILDRIVQSCKDITDGMYIRCKENAVQMGSINGFDQGMEEEIFEELTASELEVISMTSTPTRSFYQLDYMTCLLKAIKSPIVTVQQGQDYPVIMLFDIQCGQDIVGSGKYLLAPRIEND